MNSYRRRLWAASEAKTHGPRGVALVAAVTGLSEETVRRGLVELESGERPARGSLWYLRIRRGDLPGVDFLGQVGEELADVVDGQRAEGARAPNAGSSLFRPAISYPVQVPGSRYGLRCASQRSQ
jgi:hypothetical protein